MKNIICVSMLALVILGCTKLAENHPAALAQFVITPQEVKSASVETMTVVKTGRKLAALEVQFSQDKAAEYRHFTQEHLNQRIQVLVGTNVIVEPWVTSADKTGKLEVSISDFEKAQKLADLLATK
jgi:hypothetical protein